MKLIRLQLDGFGEVTVALDNDLAPTGEACIDYRSPTTGEAVSSWIPAALLPHTLTGPEQQGQPLDRTERQRDRACRALAQAILLIERLCVVTHSGCLGQQLATAGEAQRWLGERIREADGP